MLLGKGKKQKCLERIKEVYFYFANLQQVIKKLKNNG